VGRDIFGVEEKRKKRRGLGRCFPARKRWKAPDELEPTNLVGGQVRKKKSGTPDLPKKTVL
jgi:hypothetical protein